MRKHPTTAEEALWGRLRNRQLDGHKFRRQHPVQQFVVDFCCPELRLVIELDGGVHARTREADRVREASLRALGFRVLRFSNEQVLQAPDAAIGVIAAACDQEHSE